MTTQEIAKQSGSMIDQMNSCCSQGSCNLMSNNCPMMMYIFGALVILGLISMIVMQNKMLKELRKVKKK